MDKIEVPKSKPVSPPKFSIPTDDDEMRRMIGMTSEIFIKLLDIGALNEPITNPTFTIEEVNEDEIKT